ncbi:hypothetical protein [Flavobacterium collinsii]|nr:hypothetical protein [Flavobacterium collinsii]
MTRKFNEKTDIKSSDFYDDSFEMSRRTDALGLDRFYGHLFLNVI